MQVVLFFKGKKEGSKRGREEERRVREKEGGIGKFLVFGVP